MDREQFRKKILDGDDQLINSRIWRFLSADQQRMMLAGRDFWAANTPTTNAALDDFLNRYNQHQKGVEHDDPKTDLYNGFAQYAGCNVSASTFNLLVQYLLGSEAAR